MGLRDIGAALPPGFRFYPSDEELVCHYLYKKITNEEILKGTLVEIDLHTCEPWLLPEVAKLNANEWYFFSFRDRKYATGYRTNRATTCGYWKATGKDRTVVDPARKDQVVGMRKTLVFYKNRAPHGIKTGWIMHEFRLETPHMPPKEDWVLCRVFHKSKAETMSSEQLSPQYIFDSTANASSFPSSPAATLSCRLINNNVPLGLGYHHYQISSPPQPPPPPAPDSHTQNLTSNSMLNLLRSPSLQDLKTSSGIGRIISPKGDDHDHDHDHDHDDYAFMWEMEMDLHDNCSSLDRSIDNNGAVASNLGDVGFELGNSMVFI